MGSKGGSGGGSSQMGFQASTSTYTPNPEAMAAYRKALGMAENVSAIPYQPYQGQMVAGFTPDQMAAMQQTRNIQGMAQPYYNAGLEMLGQAVNYSDPRNFSQKALQQYYSPYQQNVIDTTMKNLETLQNQAYNQRESQAAMQGGWGGSSGAAMGRAEVARQQALSNAQTLAGLQQQGYQQAVGQFNQQQQQAVQTAQNAAYGLGQLGNQAQTAALQGIQALLGTGGMQQQLGQQQLSGAYQQWMQERAYPYQQAAFYSGIASGIAPNMGGTTNTMGFGSGQMQQQQAQGGGGGMGMISSLMSFLPMLMGSDERTKANIEPWGRPDPETGLQAYSYDDIGDLAAAERGERPLPPKRISYMAQDVEQVDPDAVHNLGGLKAIDMRRHHAADGGAQGMAPAAGTNPADATSGFGGFGKSIYSAPSQAAGYMDTTTQGQNSGSGQTLGQLGVPTQGSPLDPGLSQFLQGVFDPQTADQMARAKWVNQAKPLNEPATTGDNYTIPPSMMNDGGATYPYHPNDGEPRAAGGRIHKEGGGSFFDLVKQGGTGGPFADAPGNYMAEAQQMGIGKIIPKAEDKAKSITGQAAESILAKLPGHVGTGGGGGGGAGGGGGGAPKMPEMKMPKQKAAKAADATAAQPSENLGDLGAEKTNAPTPEAAPAPAPEAAPAPMDLGSGAMEAAAPADFSAMMPPQPEIPMLGMFGGFADGGRVHKDGGGAAAGAGPAALGGFGKGPADASVFGQEGGLGDIVLGNAASPAEAAGFGNLMKGQETLTGQNLMNKLTNQYWDLDPGEQKSPVEQGMPAMPDSKYYTTPREDLPGKLQSEHQGEQNPNPIPALMGMSGNQGMGMMGFMSQLQTDQQSAAAAQDRAGLQAKRAKMLADPASYPVEGYFTELGSTSKNHPEMGMQLNPRTGLYNLKYTGAYRGMPYKDGGRVGRAPGGRMQGPPMPYDPTDKDYLNLARTMHFEAGNQGDLGMLGVGHVARNRFESGRYGATPSDVVAAVNKHGVAQFTPWGTKGLGSNRPIEKYQPTEHEMALAKQALTEENDPTKGATHYYNPKISNPVWGRGMENQVQIGAHRFGTTAGGKSGGFPMMARGPSPATPEAQTQMAAGPSTPKPNIPAYTPAEIRPQLAAAQSGMTPAQGSMGDLASATPANAPVVAMDAEKAPTDFGGMESSEAPSMPEIDIPEMASGGRAELARGGGGSTYGGTQYSLSDLYDIMRQAGATPREAAQMAAIGMGESSGWSAARNPNRKTGDYSHGIWQINMLGKLGPERARRYGLSSINDLYNPVTNARIALDLLRNTKGGLHNWGAYNKQTSPYRHAMNQISKVFPELAARPVGFTAESGKRAVPYQPEARPLAFKPKEASPIVAKDAGFTPPNAGAINPTDPSGPRIGQAAPNYAQISKNPVQRAKEITGHGGFGLIGSAQAADRGVYPQGTAQGAPWTKMDEIGVMEQPQGYPTFKRQPEWRSSSMGASPNRQMLEDVPERVSSSNFPMSAQPMGTEGFSEPEQPAVVAQDRKAAPPQQMYWGDYRDVEANPFGDFIDELAGDVRSSRKAGTAATPMGKFAGQGGLGQLFDLEGTLPGAAEQPSQKSDEGFDIGQLLGFSE